MVSSFPRIDHGIQMVLYRRCQHNHFTISFEHSIMSLNLLAELCIDVVVVFRLWMILHGSDQIIFFHAATSVFQQHGDNRCPCHLFGLANIFFQHFHVMNGYNKRPILFDDDKIFVLDRDEFPAILDTISQAVMLLFNNNLFQRAKDIHVLEHGEILTTETRISHQNGKPATLF